MVQAGDVALVRSRWTITTTDAAGAQSALHVTPALVARRQSAGADGVWLVAIDRSL